MSLAATAAARAEAQRMKFALERIDELTAHDDGDDPTISGDVAERVEAVVWWGLGRDVGGWAPEGWGRQPLAMPDSYGLHPGTLGAAKLDALQAHRRRQDIDELEGRLHTMLNTVMPETRNEDVPSRLRRLIMVHARLYALAAREQS